MGRLIVIDGLDGSGKETQSERLLAALEKKKLPVKKVEFPTYGKSSALIEMYLGGAFGAHAGDVNAYAASTFFAVDRVASYLGDWKAFYEKGGTVLADRYTTSNAIHQLSKLPQEQWEEFLTWLSEFEFEKLALPRPDLVIFLDMPSEIADRLLAVRYAGDETKKDLHERDRAYQRRCREAARYCAERLAWRIISCVENGELLTREKIAAKVLAEVEKDIEC